MGKSLLFVSIISLLFMVSCKPASVKTATGGYATKSTAPTNTDATTGSSFTLVSPAVSPNFYSSITLSVNGVVSGETVQLYSDATCNTLIASKVATSTSVSFTTGILPIGVHRFYTKSFNSFGSSLCSTKYLTYDYLGPGPKIATSISLLVPASSPGYVSTPTFLLSGVTPGEMIKLYKNSTCTSIVGTVVASGTTVQITSTILSPGNYSFYTASTNGLGTSACSTISASYNYLGNLPTIATSITLSSPATTPAYDSTPTFTLDGVVSGETVELYINSTCALYVGSAVASGTSVQVTSSALAPGVYSFYTASTNSVGVSSCSTIAATYEFLGNLPTQGSSIALSSPATTPAYDSTPTLLISGVVSGETVKIYKDSSCSLLMGSAVAAGSTVQVTSSVLTPGVYSFYTATTNLLGTSSCSSFSVSYDFLGSLPTVATSISLSSPVSSPAYDSTPTLTLSGVVSGETIKIFKDSSCSTLMGSAVAAGPSVDVTSSAVAVGAYSYYTNSTNSFGTSACSTVSVGYEYLGAYPTVATSITLFSPASSPSYDATPTFLLSGVVVGETIKLYNNASCTQLVGSTVSAATSVQITSSGLATGTYSFYTTSTNSLATTPCSAALVSYQYLGALPATANTLTLVSPASSPNYVANLTYLASGGVVSGDTVSLYSDSSCATLVGSAVATSSSVNVSLSAPLVTIGTYNFYTNSTNAAGTSACSVLRASYEYLGPPPSISVSWTANKETAVNSVGGGYKVYYSTTNGFDTATAAFVDVPYVSGPTAPTTTTISISLAGTYYFKVVAYSALNPVGGSTGSVSAPSAQFLLSVP